MSHSKQEGNHFQGTHGIINIQYLLKSTLSDVYIYSDVDDELIYVPKQRKEVKIKI